MNLHLFAFISRSCLNDVAEGQTPSISRTYYVRSYTFLVDNNISRWISVQLDWQVPGYFEMVWPSFRHSKVTNRCRNCTHKKCKYAKEFNRKNSVRENNELKHNSRTKHYRDTPKTLCRRVVLKNKTLSRDSQDVVSSCCIETTTSECSSCIDRVYTFSASLCTRELVDFIFKTRHWTIPLPQYHTSLDQSLVKRCEFDRAGENHRATSGTTETMAI